ncbi:MAG: hypothetical protein JSV49_07775 [Thermoplasmata archaeon]|nr:MAG: hypothetical protein JSV49_07775 [Thermoplasmata archaeon]
MLTPLNWNFGLLNRVVILFIVTIMIISSGVSAAPGEPEPELNPVPPEYFDISGPERLTDNIHRSIMPNILIDSEDNLHLIWADSRADPDPDDGKFLHAIFYKKFDKFGEVMIDDTQLTDLSYYGGYPYQYFFPDPNVAFDSEENIHMAYVDGMKNGFNGYYPNFEIYYMKLDSGLDYGGESAVRSELVLIDEQRVSEGVVHSGDPVIAIDSGDNAHIVWYDHRSCNWNYEIYYEKISPAGAVLIDDMAITSYLGYCAGPSLDIDTMDNLHIGFKCYDWWTFLNSQYYLKMDNDGTILVGPTVFANEGKSTPYLWYKGYPAVVVDGDDNVHMAWADERWSSDYEVSYMKLDNNGAPLMAGPQRISDTPGKSSLQEFGIDDSGRLYLLWRDDTPGDYQIYMSVLNPDGSTLMDQYQLTASASLSESPSMAVDSNGYIHIAFMDTITLYPEIYKIVLMPRLVNLAFVATGVGSGALELTIYEDNDKDVIAQVTITRTPGNPVESVAFVSFLASREESYSLECNLVAPTAKKSGFGAVPLKIYSVEEGELAHILAETVVNKNAGKNPKSCSSIDLDAIIP